MAFHMLIIALILAGVGFAGYKYYQFLSKSEENHFDEENDFTDIDTLKEKIAEQFAMMQKQDVRERNLTKKQYEQNQRHKAELRYSLKEAAYGNSVAKKKIKAYIVNMLTDPSLGMGINSENINDIIPFEHESELHAEDKFEILLYIYANLVKDEVGRPLGKGNFSRIVKDFNLLDPVVVNGDVMYDFTAERLNHVYHEVQKKYHLSFTDKMNILAQRIFEKYKGFGIVDTLLDTGLDEIDCGVSGISKDGYEVTSAQNLTYSYQSIWVTISGIKLRLSCISFDSQEELVRVTQNIYKYGANKVLNKKTGKVISTMKNGNRITVARPPFNTSYAFWARKFDSASSLEPEFMFKGVPKMVNGKLQVHGNAEIPQLLIKWLIKGERTCAITGSQGTGKTTMLKSIVRYIPAHLSIRVQEISAELNLQYAYPHRNIVAFQETETISSQEGLNFQKKTNGDVNIIGEVAEAIQTNFVIQTAKVASRFALFTHHGKTADAMVAALANDLLNPTCGIYKEKKEAIETVAETINIDMHLTNSKGDRYMERITEIIPAKKTKYPTEVQANATPDDDAREYYKRITDRELFQCQNIMEFDEATNSFQLVHMPSDAMMDEIKSVLKAEDIEAFEKDMAYLKEKYLKKDNKSEVA